MVPSARRDSVDRHVEHWRDELPGLDPLHEAIVARLMQVSRHLAQGRADAFDRDGLSLQSFKTLLALRRLGPPYTTSPSQLADHLHLTRGALSARLAPLEDAGLISRTVDREDRRRVHVRLTEAGRRAVAAHADDEGRHEAALLGTLSRADQRHLADLLRELTLAIEDASHDRG